MTAEEKNKSREFLGKLHDKDYGKRKSGTQTPQKVPEKPNDPDLKDLPRKQLRLRAIAKGIYNYNVLNKQELIEVLRKDTAQPRINDIVCEAYSRWVRTCLNRKKSRNRRI